MLVRHRHRTDIAHPWSFPHQTRSTSQAAFALHHLRERCAARSWRQRDASGSALCTASFTSSLPVSTASDDK